MRRRLRRILRPLTRHMALHPSLVDCQCDNAEEARRMDGLHPGSVSESFLTFGTRIIETMHTLYEWSA